MIESLTRRVSPLSASAYSNGLLRFRLSGLESDVAGEQQSIGGDVIDNGYWRELDALDAFHGASHIWRLSTHALAPVEHDYDLMDWGFAQRWLVDPEFDPREGFEGEEGEGFEGEEDEGNGEEADIVEAFRVGRWWWWS